MGHRPCLIPDATPNAFRGGSNTQAGWQQQVASKAHSFRHISPLDLTAPAQNCMVSSSGNRTFGGDILDDCHIEDLSSRRNERDTPQMHQPFGLSGGD